MILLSGNFRKKIFKVISFTYNNEMAVNIPKNIENTRDNDHGWLLYTFPSKKN